MTFPHLFEFMDLEWLPAGLRNTLREILECGNSEPFRPYYRRVSEAVLCCAKNHGIHTVVELGAGTAPLTRHMSTDARSEGLRLVVCDNNPDQSAYVELEKRHPGKVQAIREPVDFAQVKRWEPGTLLVLSATLHHIPSANRTHVIKALAESAERIMIFEPLRKTVLSVLFVFLSLTPAVLLPILMLHRPGRLRRFLWCWLLPAAPLMFLWDGIVSCIRQWSEDEWRTELGKIPGRAKGAVVKHSYFCQEAAW